MIHMITLLHVTHYLLRTCTFVLLFKQYRIISPVTDTICVLRYYIPINTTPFELHVFRSSDTENHIKLTSSESLSLFLKMRLMTLLMTALLNIAPKTSNVPRYFVLKKNGIF